MVVNVTHLIVLELYFELNNPQIYSDNTDQATQRESDSEMEEVMSEVDGSVSGSPPVRPSRRTAQAYYTSFTQRLYSRLIASIKHNIAITHFYCLLVKITLLFSHDEKNVEIINIIPAPKGKRCTFIK